MKQRQRLILEALLNCGGSATTGAIAKKAKLHPNGVSQSLGVLTGFVTSTFGAKRETIWKLKSRKLPQLSLGLWTKLNTRRIDLIDMKAGGYISEEEAAELADLEKTADRVRDRMVRFDLARLKRLMNK